MVARKRTTKRKVTKKPRKKRKGFTDAQLRKALATAKRKGLTGLVKGIQTQLRKRKRR